MFPESEPSANILGHTASKILSTKFDVRVKLTQYFYQGLREIPV